MRRKPTPPIHSARSSLVSPETRLPLFLGIEGGGTRTTARLENLHGEVQFEWAGGPGNIRLLSDSDLAALLKDLALRVPVVDSVFAGFAGARLEPERGRIRAVLQRYWPAACIGVGTDLDTAFASAQPIVHSGKPIPQVLVLSGTGSCCVGRDGSEKQVRIGGWGHLLGDKGSAYDIGLRALKAVVYYLDRDGDWSGLGQRLLRALVLNQPEDLIAWIQSAPKEEVARLALEVFEAAAGGDQIARDILEGASHQLAKDAMICIRKLSRKGGRVQVLFSGGTLVRQPRFLAQVQRELRAQWDGTLDFVTLTSGVTGAVKWARDLHLANTAPTRVSLKRPPTRSGKVVRADSEWRVELPEPTGISTTEERNPRSLGLDRMSIGSAVRMMLHEDEAVPKAVLAEARRIGKVVGWVTQSIQSGGRLIYVGAGTSGRLGVLDASECPPTFRTPPEMVQGIIAGGQRALWDAVEGAEDDVHAGMAAVRYREVGPRDVVIGLAASGRTPFVWGALTWARRRHARTVVINCNPRLRYPARMRPDEVISLDVGPEVLTGSTRLKSGTATKLALNVITTLTMVRLGKVVSNLMVDLNPSNIKLRGRAVRIVRQLTGMDEESAKMALEKAGWVVGKVVRKGKKFLGTSAEEDR